MIYLLDICFFRFPSKEEVLNYVVNVTRNRLKKQPKTLVVVGAYSIGKECVFLAISKALGVGGHLFTAIFLICNISLVCLSLLIRVQSFLF